MSCSFSYSNSIKMGQESKLLFGCYSIVLFLTRKRIVQRLLYVMLTSSDTLCAGKEMLTHQRYSLVLLSFVFL